MIVRGQVQGVGFRPHVYKIATELGLTGFVRNTSAGVCIEIQGDNTHYFLDLLYKKLPALAKITEIKTHTLALQNNETAFVILKSLPGKISTIISPDINTCNDCLSELFDQNNRYFQYPFLNCTQCGPRLTITKALPYDRYQTALSEFILCEDCKNEYGNPLNRRYHAQPTACAVCGPTLSSSIEDIITPILQGDIVALKSLGGYQLICDAQNEAAILKLRERKKRDAKPFAVMMSDIDLIKKYFYLDEFEKCLIESKERPIVLLKKKNNLLSDAIAPQLSHFGIMLPYTPLHYLLLHALSHKKSEIMLIMTSANVSNEPILCDDNEAQSSLHGIADKIVSYNRAIVTRVDDSVMRLVNNHPFFIRRARGFVPTPIQLSHAIPETLAMGGHLKNTFCITRKDEAFVSQHIGSLNNKTTIDFFHETLTHFLRFLSVKPLRIAHDRHPDFYTTRFALENNIPTISVQHHHAHLASVIAEYHIDEKVLGLVLDGYGYGLNGEAWGGELFVLENTMFERIGHLYPLAQPGGEIAAKEPWRMGVSVLYEMGNIQKIGEQFGDQHHIQLLLDLLNKKLHVPRTSSCGRLFDAAAALLNVKSNSDYEGHAAMCLESLVTQPHALSHGWHFNKNILNFMSLLQTLSDISNPIEGSNLFHGTLIAGLVEWIYHNAINLGIKTVVLSGGCFLNKVLSEGLIQQLNFLGITALLPKQLPPNDGGISLGQAWIAGHICV